MTKAKKAGANPGTQAGTESGDTAGEVESVSLDVVYGDLDLSGEKIGTIESPILTVPHRGIRINITNTDGQVSITPYLDGDALLDAAFTADATGETFIDPDKNKQAADKPEHTLTVDVTDDH